jgi:hypothetical protein
VTRRSNRRGGEGGESARSGEITQSPNLKNPSARVRYRLLRRLGDVVPSQTFYTFSPSARLITGRFRAKANRHKGSVRFFQRASVKLGRDRSSAEGKSLWIRAGVRGVCRAGDAQEGVARARVRDSVSSAHVSTRARRSAGATASAPSGALSVTILEDSRAAYGRGGG